MSRTSTSGLHVTGIEADDALGNSSSERMTYHDKRRIPVIFGHHARSKSEHDTTRRVLL